MRAEFRSLNHLPSPVVTVPAYTAALWLRETVESLGLLASSLRENTGGPGRKTLPQENCWRVIENTYFDLCNLAEVCTPPSPKPACIAHTHTQIDRNTDRHTHT